MVVPEAAPVYQVVEALDGSEYDSDDLRSGDDVPMADFVMPSVTR